ncbi:MAG: DegV family protein, partial [Acutalibacteraceae bacterium]|nr:DegV family protein [Acutalibacteraceae bacterium]
MNKTAIMTDTNSGITPEVAKENGIFLLEMPFVVDGKEYIEYGEMSYSEFFEVLESGAEVSTSQPSPAALIEMWDDILNDYEAVVYFPMSSGLSGTCDTAKALAADYDGRVFVVDNKRISVTLYTSVFNAVKLANNGLSAKEIAEICENEAAEQSIYV